MTTIESPALPEWEAKTRDRQPLPGLNDERATDLGYLYAAIQDMRTYCAGYAAAHSSDSASRRALELALLDDRLNAFAAGIHAHSASGDEFLSVLTAVAPAVNWYRGASGGFTGYMHGDEQAASKAARTLRLREWSPVGTIRVWRGEIEGWTVQVNHYER